jgi:hypothetical protein
MAAGQQEGDLVRRPWFEVGGGEAEDGFTTVMSGKGNYSTPTCPKLVSICFDQVCEIDAWVCPVSCGLVLCF